MNHKHLCQMIVTKQGYKTREQFAPELGMCARTVKRKLDELGFYLGSGKMLSPEVQHAIKVALKVIF